MDVRCERCRAQYVVDDDRVPETGVAVTCAHCGYVFRLRKKALIVTVPLRPDEGVEAQPITGLAPKVAPQPVGTREWRLRQANGSVWAFRELTTLQKWIVERKAGRDDEISAGGEQWRRLGDITELLSFFEVVDAAEKAQGTPGGRSISQASGGAPLSAAPRAKTPAVALDEPAWARGPIAHAPAPSARGRGPRNKARHGGSWLGLLALALAGGVFATWIYLAREREAARRISLGADASVGEPADQAKEPPPPTPVAHRPEPVAALPAPSLAAAPVAPATSARGEVPAPVRAVPATTAAPAGAALAPAAPTPPASVVSAAAAPAATPPPAAAPDTKPAPAAAAAAKPAPAAAKKPPAPPAKGVKALLQHARKLRERGQTDEALGLYGEAIDLEPTNAAALAGRGACFLDTSEYALAEANFRAALESDPKNAEALFGMAETYRYMGKTAEAVTFYERFIAIHPDGDDAVAARNAISKLKE